jgi:hypothetical protein
LAAVASSRLGKTDCGDELVARATMIEFSPALRVAAVLGGIIALIIAIRVGQVMIRLFFGIIGLALLGGAIWWFFVRP